MSAVQQLRDWRANTDATLEFKDRGSDWVVTARREDDVHFEFTAVNAEVEKASEAILAKLKMVGEKVEG